MTERGAMDREELVAHVDAWLPSHALAFSEGGVDVLAWRFESLEDAMPPDDARSGTWIMHRGGAPRFEAETSVLKFIGPLTREGVLGYVHDVGSGDRSLAGWQILYGKARAGFIRGDESRLEAIGGIVDGLDVAAFALSVRAGSTSSSVRDLLSSHRRGAAGIQGFARTHPWLVEAAAGQLAGVSSAHLFANGPDAAAATMLWLRYQWSERRMVERLRWFRPAREADDFIPFLRDVPDRLLPPPLAPGDAPDAPSRQRMLAMTSVLPLAGNLARSSGRPLGSFVPGPMDWCDRILALASRCGLP